MEEPDVSQEVEDEFPAPSDEADPEKVPVADGEDSPLPEDRETADDGGRSDAEGLAEDRPRRSFKVVLTLQPSDGTGFQALFALGAGGCDPIFHAMEVPDLAAALHELPGIMAEAEDQWANQPRYPAAAPQKTGRAAAPRTAAKPGTAPAESPPPTVQPASEPAPSDQMALFG